MKNMILSLLSMAVLTACSAKADNKTSETQSTETKTEEMTENQANPTDVKVLISTSLGDIEVLLYGDTPKHQANFIKLVKDGYYNGTLFHRVINEFMVQAGDPDSKNAPAGKSLGQGGPGYQIDAEFVYPRHFHKRGALAAARTADQINPERKSSGSQFYIVTGKAYTASELDQMEQQLKQAEMQKIFYQIAGERRAEITSMQQKGDQAGLQQLQEEIIALAESKAGDVKFTPEQREAYSTVGGTPFLDNQYTVFGEVVRGMDVVEKIEKTKTGAGDRPVEDVKILSMKIEE